MTTSTNNLIAATTTKGLRLRGSLAVQNGVPMLVTFASAGDVSKASKVDIYDSETKKGYQRDPQPLRVRKATEYYQSGGRMPNPLLVNIREEDFGDLEIHISDDRAGYEAAIESGGDWIGAADIHVPKGVTLWIYDGQHREGAIEALLDGDPDEYGSFPIPLSITLGLSSAEEMKEFYEVNQNAKAVKTDLAWELLRIMAEEDPALAELLELRNEDWKTKGADVADALIALGGVWSDKIQRANVKKAPKDRLTLGIAQFTRSLQPVLSMPAFSKADSDQIAKVLDAYWAGIALALPEPFAKDADPKKYVIQKGPGAIAFHRILPQVVEVLRARGARLADPNAYADVLKELPTLSGEIVSEDGESEMVTGADFWKAGPQGVASQWTGDAGRKRLAVRIQALIPRPSDELNL